MSEIKKSVSLKSNSILSHRLIKVNYGNEYNCIKIYRNCFNYAPSRKHLGKFITLFKMKPMVAVEMCTQNNTSSKV